MHFNIPLLRPTRHREARRSHRVCGGVSLRRFLPAAMLATVMASALAEAGPVWRRAATAGPGPRERHAMAYDSARGKVVLYGGYSLSSYTALEDTWEWNGSAWTQVSASGPGTRYSATMAYDAARQRIVLHGGNSTSSDLGDTWTWNGTTWVRVATSGPPARRGASMAYDGDRSRIVLFGGYTPSAGEFGDTWEWNGTIWAQAAASGPEGRQDAAMAYDAARRQVVLFGAPSGLEPVSDTWVYGVAGPAPYTMSDARDALRHAGGLATLPADRLGRYNVVTSGPSATRIDIADAAAIARKAAGLTPNP